MEVRRVGYFAENTGCGLENRRGRGGTSIFIIDEKLFASDGIGFSRIYS